MSLNSTFTFNTTPSVVFGSGTTARIGTIAATRLGPRILVVTDAGLVRAGLLASALEALRREGVAAEVFDGVVADPPRRLSSTRSPAPRPSTPTR